MLRSASCQIVIQRSLIVALHGNLGVHRERYAVLARAEGLDFLVRAWFLRAEIVGREAEDDESLILVLFVSRLPGQYIAACNRTGWQR